MGAEVVWMIIMVTGLVISIGLILDAIGAGSVASARGFNLARKLALAELISGLLFAFHFVVSIWLGYLALTDSGLIRNVFAETLLVSSATVVAALTVLWVTHYRIVRTYSGEDQS